MASEDGAVSLQPIGKADAVVTRVLSPEARLAGTLRCTEPECDLELEFDLRYVYPDDVDVDSIERTREDALSVRVIREEYGEVETVEEVSAFHVRGDLREGFQRRLLAHLVPGDYQIQMQNVTRSTFEMSATARVGVAMPGPFPLPVDEYPVGRACAVDSDCADGYFCHAGGEGTPFCTAECGYPAQCDWRSLRVLDSSEPGGGVSVDEFECIDGICDVDDCAVAGEGYNDFLREPVTLCTGR